MIGAQKYPIVFLSWRASSLNKMRRFKRNRIHFFLIAFFVWGHPVLFAHPSPQNIKSSLWATFKITGIKVRRNKKSSKTWPAIVRIPIKVGNELRTKDHSRADLRLGPSVLVRMKENAVLKVKRVTFSNHSMNAVLKLVSGKVFIKINKRQFKGSQFALQTPTMIAAVRGTEFAVEVKDHSTSKIEVIEGTVHAASFQEETPAGEPIETQSVEVEAGQETIVAEGQPPAEPAEMKPEERQGIRQWAGEPEYKAPEPEEGAPEGTAEPNAPKEKPDEIIQNEENPSQAPAENPNAPEVIEMDDQ